MGLLLGWTHRGTKAALLKSAASPENGIVKWFPDCPLLLFAAAASIRVRLSRAAVPIHQLLFYATLPRCVRALFARVFLPAANEQSISAWSSLIPWIYRLMEVNRLFTVSLQWENLWIIFLHSITCTYFLHLEIWFINAPEMVDSLGMHEITKRVNFFRVLAISTCLDLLLLLTVPSISKWFVWRSSLETLLLEVR